MERKILFDRILADEPKYRITQAQQALFLPQKKGWSDITTFSKELRQKIEQHVPWMSVRNIFVFESKKRDTFKALLEVEGGERIETVLMQNARGFWSICVSSQVGCAMACTFCATGKMGFTRSLTADEIVDQYRFWRAFLDDRHDLEQRISNVVYMGMGEPLANYENVRSSLQIFLAFTDMGPTRLTVSTVGLIPMLRKLLTDPEWPPVRLAVSLHSADALTRQNIMPTSYTTFLDNLAEWTRDYFKKFSSRRRHLTFEYVMLSGVNDSPTHAKKLVQFAQRIGKVRVNLIPYNDTKSRYATSESKDLLVFESILQRGGVDVTRRRTMGEDIAAACGQLTVEKKEI